MSRKRVLLAGAVLGAIALAAVLFQTLVPTCVLSIRHANEAVLRDDLFTMRSCIHQYTLDRQKRPEQLQDLVRAGYLRTIPKDPFTKSSDTWRLTPDGDVHSGASAMGSDGKPYSFW